MKRLVLAVAFVALAGAAQAHCYSVWKYPTPQKCGVYARTTKANPEKTWFVEITQLPPDPDPRSDADIADQAEHDAAIAQRKGEINLLMEILKAEEAAGLK